MSRWKGGHFGTSNTDSGGSIGKTRGRRRCRIVCPGSRKDCNSRSSQSAAIGHSGGRDGSSLGLPLGRGGWGCVLPWAGSQTPHVVGGCSSSTKDKPGLSALPSEYVRGVGQHFGLALSYGRELYAGKIESNKKKKKKSLKLLLAFCALFPSGFPLSLR